MTTVKAERYLLSRLGAGTTALLALLLDLPSMPAWCDGVDASDRSVLLVGRHALGAGEAQNAAATVFEALGAGEVPASPLPPILRAEVVELLARALLADILPVPDLPTAREVATSADVPPRGSEGS